MVLLRENTFLFFFYVRFVVVVNPFSFPLLCSGSAVCCLADVLQKLFDSDDPAPATEKEREGKWSFCFATAQLSKNKDYTYIFSSTLLACSTIALWSFSMYNLKAHSSCVTMFAIGLDKTRRPFYGRRTRHTISRLREMIDL